MKMGGKDAYDGVQKEVSVKQPSLKPSPKGKGRQTKTEGAKAVSTVSDGQKPAKGEVLEASKVIDARKMRPTKQGSEKEEPVQETNMKEKKIKGVPDSSPIGARAATGRTTKREEAQQTLSSVSEGQESEEVHVIEASRVVAGRTMRWPAKISKEAREVVESILKEKKIEVVEVESKFSEETTSPTMKDKKNKCSQPVPKMSTELMEEDWTNWKKEFAKVAGEKVAVKGDGFCWLYAVLTSMNMMERPSSPTQDDYALVSTYLGLLKDFVRSGTCGRWLQDEARHKFMCIKEPPTTFDIANYGGTEVAFRVIAAFSSVAVIVVNEPVLEASVLTKNDGSMVDMNAPHGAFTMVSGTLRATVQ